MIQINESDKRKIKALSMKTVSNGATIEEEKSAQKKIQEIKSKYKEEEYNYNHNKHQFNTFTKQVIKRSKIKYRIDFYFKLWLKRFNFIKYCIHKNK